MSYFEYVACPRPTNGRRHPLRDRDSPFLRVLFLLPSIVMIGSGPTSGRQEKGVGLARQSPLPCPLELFGNGPEQSRAAGRVVDEFTKDRRRGSSQPNDYPASPTEVNKSQNG